MDDVDFLDRIYNLEEFPSYDDRYSNAAGDIWQHRHNNYDWENDWIFSDARFNLTGCSDVEFLKFICEMAHPVVRPDAAQAKKIIDIANEHLRHDGWKLIPERQLAGRSTYSPSRTTEFHSAIKRASTAAEILESSWMQKEIERIQASVDQDPALAIGTAKDLVESCCKAILEDCDTDLKPEKTDDLPKLSKKVCTVLKLVPEGISSEVKGAEIIRRTLSNLASITKSVAELRGLYGSGHGRDGRHIGLEPRHARLAASSAITFVEFVTETHLKH